MTESNPSPTEVAFRKQAKGDAKLFDLLWQRERILAEAMGKMSSPTSQVPERLTNQLRQVSSDISKRLLKIEDLRLKAGTDDLYFELLIEADDLLEASKANPQDGDLLQTWDIAQAAVQEYEEQTSPPGFTDQG